MLTEKERAELFRRMQKDGCSITDGMAAVKAAVANASGIWNREQLNNIVGYCMTRNIILNTIHEVIRTVSEVGGD